MLNGGENMQNVGVVFGGKSSEHDVSIITAIQTIEKLKIDQFNIVPIYVTQENEMYIGKGLDKFSTYKNFSKKKLTQVCFTIGSNYLFKINSKGTKTKSVIKLDFVYNCCHGGAGENGLMSAVFEMCNIPSSSGDYLSLGICMDKVVAKYFFIANDLPVIDFFAITKNDWITNKNQVVQQLLNFKLPVIIKPARQGSSIGVCLANTLEEFVYGMQVALKFDNKVLIERAIIEKTEFNCSVIRGENKIYASDIEEPENDKVVLSFEAKYLDNKNIKGNKGKMKVSSIGFDKLGIDQAKRKLPANIDDKICAKIKKLSRLCYQLLDLNGVIRIDYIYDTLNKKIYINEINAIPGSLAFYFWKKMDMFSNIYTAGKKYWTNRFVPEKYKSHIFDNL